MKDSVARWKMGVLLVALFVCLLNLHRMTAGLRVATADDAFVARALSEPEQASANRLHDYRIGRIYADLKFHLLESLMRVSSDTLHSTIRVALFFAAALAASWFVFEWTHSGSLSAAVLLLQVGLLQISISYQAFLSLPWLWLGWGAVWSMGALAFRPPSTLTRVGIPLAFAAALVVHEANAIYAVWPWALRSAARSRLPRQTELCELAMCLGILGVYGALSLALRHAAIDPGNVYDGATISCDMRDSPFALCAYSISAVPGIEPWIARGRGLGEIVLLSPIEWAQRTLSSAVLIDWIGATMLGFAIWASVGASDELRRSQPVWPVLAVLVAAAFAPNVLLALTPKYQVWAHHRMWPYYYGSMSYLVWVVVITISVARGLTSPLPLIRRSVVRVLFAATALVCAIGITAVGREAVRSLRERTFEHWSR